MTIELIKTTSGTARLMDANGLLEDLHVGIHAVFKLLTNDQRDDIFNYASTEITNDQENSIREMI